jgi:hypothetical protein
LNCKQFVLQKIFFTVLLRDFMSTCRNHNKAEHRASENIFSLLPPITPPSAHKQSEKSRKSRVEGKEKRKVYFRSCSGKNFLGKLFDKTSFSLAQGKEKEDKSRSTSKKLTRNVIVSNLAQHQQKAKKHNIWQRAEQH